MDTGTGWDERTARPFDERDHAGRERTDRPRAAALENGGDDPHAFLYRTERSLRLRDIENALRRVCAVTLRSRDREVEVHAVRATCPEGRAVHVRPAALPEGLYLDHRDLRAVEAGGIVPGLEEALVAVTRKA